MHFLSDSIYFNANHVVTARLNLSFLVVLFRQTPNTHAHALMSGPIRPPIMSSNPSSSKHPIQEAQPGSQDIWGRLRNSVTLMCITAYSCLPVAYFFLAIQESAPLDTFRLRFM